MIWLSLASLPALAQSLAWTWTDDTVHTWHLETVVDYASPIWLHAQHNIEGRAERIQSEQIWTCRATATGRSGWELDCHVDDVRLVVLALAGEETAVEAVVQELVSALRGASVQLQLDGSGHVRGVDLEGQAKDGRRSGAIHETLRLLVARSAAGFDLHLPPSGDLRPTWRQKDDLLHAYPISYGSLSGARVTHTLGDHDARHASVHSVGTGTVRVGDPAPQPGRPPGDDEAWMLDMASEAQALFDGLQGVLVARRWVAVGRPISSSGWQVGQPVTPYLQSGLLTLMSPGETPDPLGTSGLWTDTFAPGAAWQQLVTNPLWQASDTP